MNDKLKIQFWKTSSLNPRILDLGCGSPTQYICWFKEFKIQKNRYFNYEGVDISDEFKIYHDNMPDELLQERYEIDSNDWIKKIREQCCLNVTEETDFEIDLSLFTNHFRFHFNTNVVDYIKVLPRNEKYDCIILSNLLHKLENNDAEFVFTECLSHLDNDGIIYVCVLGNNYERKLEEDNLYSLERYLLLKQKVNVLWSSENDRYHFQFIGKK